MSQVNWPPNNARSKQKKAEEKKQELKHDCRFSANVAKSKQGFRKK
jgi:hypothetical protein